MHESPNDPEHKDWHRSLVHVFSTFMMILFGVVAAAIVIPEVVYKVAGAFGYLDHQQACPELWGLGRSLMYGVASALASAGFAFGAPASAGNRFLEWVVDNLPGK